MGPSPSGATQPKTRPSAESAGGPGNWCDPPELNWGHTDFQSVALPTELGSQVSKAGDVSRPGDPEATAPAPVFGPVCISCHTASSDI